MDKDVLAYKDFEVTDFLADDFFLGAIRRPTTQSSRFWDAYCSTYPQQQEKFERARQLVLHMQVKTHQPDEAVVRRVWQRLEMQAHEVQIVRMKRKRMITWMSAAAACLVLAFALYTLLPGGRHIQVQVTAATGEIREHILPDGSRIMLTAHSSISYDSTAFTHNRVLQSSGEVYFEVQHTQQGQPFEVIAGGERIEVLGTSFLVNDRTDTLMVALAQGKVRFHYQHGNVDLAPEEVYAYTRITGGLSKLPVKASDLLHWKNNEWDFNNTSLEEILHILRTYYGYKIRVRDAWLLRQRYTGYASTGHISGLLENLKLIYKMDITSRKDSLIFSAAR